MTGGARLAVALGCAVALAASHWYVLELGRDQGAAACISADSRRKDVVIEAVTNRVAENEVEKQQNEAKARKVSNAVQSELGDVRDFQPAVIRVQFPALPGPGCRSAAGSAEAPGASGFDGAAAGTVVFPEEIQRAFDEFAEGAGRLEKEADAVTAVARGHQQFARENGLYGEAQRGAEK